MTPSKKTKLERTVRKHIADLDVVKPAAEQIVAMRLAKETSR